MPYREPLPEAQISDVPTHGGNTQFPVDLVFGDTKLSFTVDSGNVDKVICLIRGSRYPFQQIPTSLYIGRLVPKILWEKKQVDENSVRVLSFEDVAFRPIEKGIIP